MRILFIGNSHTYFNDLPEMVAKLFRKDGEECEVTMIAHGGWFLEQHTKEPDVKFNILYGHYDYVVLQEHSHPFGPVEKFESALIQLNEWIRQGGSVPVVYMTWAMKEQPYEQERMTTAHREAAEKIDALVAPVGELWWGYREKFPEKELYYTDGAHASADGSMFAAVVIYQTIKADQMKD